MTDSTRGPTALPEPVPYSGGLTIPRTDLVQNEVGLLLRSQASYDESFAHVKEYLCGPYAQELRKIGGYSPAQIERICGHGLGRPANIDGLTASENVVYATWERRALVLDLYAPDASEAAQPVILLIHGGGWIQNSHRTYRNLAVKLARQGFATACVEYRLAGEATYPGAIYDIKAAVRWVRANATRLNFDADRIILAGGSAGGQLAALTALTRDDPRYEGSANNLDQSSDVHSLVLLDGFADGPASDIWLNDPVDELRNDMCSLHRVTTGRATTIPSILTVNGPMASGNMQMHEWICAHRQDVRAQLVETPLPHAYEIVDELNDVVVGWISDFCNQTPTEDDA